MLLHLKPIEGARNAGNGIASKKKLEGASPLIGLPFHLKPLFHPVHMSYYSPVDMSYYSPLHMSYCFSYNLSVIC